MQKEKKTVCVSTCLTLCVQWKTRKQVYDAEDGTGVVILIQLRNIIVYLGVFSTFMSYFYEFSIIKSNYFCFCYMKVTIKRLSLLFFYNLFANKHNTSYVEL